MEMDNEVKDWCIGKENEIINMVSDKKNLEKERNKRERCLFIDCMPSIFGTVA